MSDELAGSVLDRIMTRQTESDHDPSLGLSMVFFGKPVSTFPDHAQAEQNANGSVGLSTVGFPLAEISAD